MQTNKILRDKTDLSEKYISLDRKHRKYLRWETKLYKSITEDKQASVHLKQLANQMTEELEEFQEVVNPRGTVSSTTSDTSTGNNTVTKDLFHLIKYKIFFFSHVLLVIHLNYNIWKFNN